MTESGQRQIQGIQRAMECLALVGDNGGQASYGQLQAGLHGLADATLSRLLKSLCAGGLLRHQNTSYYLGAEALLWSKRVWGGDQPLQVLQQLLADFTSQWGVSTAVFQRDHDGLRCVLKEEVEGAVGYVGQGRLKTPLCGQGCAQVFAAFDDEANDVWGTQLASDLRLSTEEWQQRRERICQQGYWHAAREELPPPRSLLRNHLWRHSVPCFYGANDVPQWVACIAVMVDSCDESTRSELAHAFSAQLRPFIKNTS